MKGRYLLLLLLFANFGVMVVGQVEPERDVSEVPIHDKAVSDYDFLSFQNSDPGTTTPNTEHLGADCKKFVNYIAVDDGTTTLQDWCSSHSCCQGEFVCHDWSSDATYEVCENSCNNSIACRTVANQAQSGDTIKFDVGSCNGASSCYAMAYQATNLHTLIVGNYACRGYRSCYYVAGEATSLKQLIIPDGQCGSFNSCKSCGKDSNFDDTLQLTETCCAEESDESNGSNFDTACNYFDLTSNQPSISSSPSNQPSNQPSISSIPSDQPSSVPSSIPSSIPSDFPTRPPTSEPSPFPTRLPSSTPSNEPSFIPSVSIVPSSEPSDQPSNQPSISSSPSDQPSNQPSNIPSEVPSDQQSSVPSDIPSDQPSSVPSKSSQPSSVPSKSNQPSSVPSTSDSPSDQPSSVLSLVPSDIPSFSPSSLSSDVPSLTSSNLPSAENEGCQDDKDATFFRIKKNSEFRKCKWLTKNNKADRKKRYCRLNRVKSICKSTCSFCTCADNDSFIFELTNVFNPDKKIKTCDWLASKNNSAVRIARYCNKAFDDGAVMNACTKSCGLCDCTDDDSFTFKAINISDPNKKIKTCSWLSKNKKYSEKRISRYCTKDFDGGAVMNACTKSCGLCG